jgi:hypothetical protein
MESEAQQLINEIRDLIEECGKRKRRADMKPYRRLARCKLRWLRKNTAEEGAFVELREQAVAAGIFDD